MTPRVSIIIPVYNVEQYIVECLQSVADQTVADKIECLIVDDCGSDNSFVVAKEWVRGYRLKDRGNNVDFKLLQREENGGLSAARNSGIEKATGELLYFLDSDDILTVDCIEKMLECATGADMVQGTYISNTEMLTSFHKDIPAYSQDQQFIKRTMLDYDRFPVMAQNRLVKRSIIVDNAIYFKEGIIHEDCHWTYFLAKYIHTLSICNHPTYYYRDNPNGITGNKNIEKETRAFSTIIQDFSQNIDPIADDIQKKLILYHLITLLDNNYYKDENVREELIEEFARKNNVIERLLLRLFLRTKSNKALHLLERIYKL